MLSIIEFEQEIEGGEHELAETRGNFTRILGTPSYLCPFGLAAGCLLSQSCIA
jgi:hypothetical protein